MNLSLLETLGAVSPLILGFLVLASIIHSFLTSRRKSSGNYFVTPIILTLCLAHMLLAAGAYWHLVTGGWLRTHYHWNDPDLFNLALALFEPIPVATVVCLFLFRTPFLHTFLLDLFCIQMLLVAAAVILLFVFIMTWQPRMF